ncbi:hypothetical protein GCM10018963_53230 [Saccharothrix longispora]
MPESSGETRSLRGRIRGFLTIAWVVISGVQFTIWLLMSLISTSFKTPFWLWTVGLGGGALLLWWFLDPARRDRERTE